MARDRKLRADVSPLPDPPMQDLPGPTGVVPSVMLWVAGKRFACERCGANVFSRAGENFACNGCGTLYGGKEGQ